MFTPIVQLGQAPTQPMQATAPADMLPAAGTQQDQQTASLGAITGSRNIPFNFGVAQFETASGAGSVGQDINGKSLGDVARERRHPNASNARMYTNSDIDQLNQVGGTVSTPSAQANNNSNWSSNNGVITPDNCQPTQNTVAAPAQQNQAQPPANHTPFGPKPPSQNPSPTGIDMTPSQPQSRPQSEVRPLTKREGVEIAQNDQQNAPQAQPDQSSSNAQTATAQSQPAQDQAPQNHWKASQLPRTASRLPLVGVAGLFSVSMGIFVRYQRAKAK